jgi:kanamycin kinase
VGSAPSFSELPFEARRHLAAGRSELIYAPYRTATWRTLDGTGHVRFLKAGFVGAYPGLAAERDRCVWLGQRGLAVPRVLDHGTDDRVEWLLTAEVGGVAAVEPGHLGDPARTVPVLAEGLRAFHEVDPTDCPFDYRVRRAIDHAAGRVAGGWVDPAGFHDAHRHLDPEAALVRLRALAPDDEHDVVVCHGDYCFPNVLLDGGRVVGYLDLGEVGVAERWRDLAVATWSVTWNVGPGYEDLFLDAYGVAWDHDRRDFYRLLYDLEA